MRINAGTKDELEVIGYRPDRTKWAITIILCILSGGLLLLLLSWKASIRLKFTHVQCNVTDATVVIATDIYGQVWEEPVEEEDTLSPEWRKIHRKFFFNKKIKYIWDPDAAAFTRLSFPPVGCQMSNLRSESGLSEVEARKRLHIFGPNLIHIEIPTIWKLFVSQAYNPFYIFQAYTILVWYVQTYAIYATCIFLLSVISIVMNIWETRRQARSLRKKMVTESKVQVIRDGQVLILDSKEIVPGDVTIVVAGSEFLEADMVLQEGSVVMNEALLTGESIPITKVELDSNDNSIFNLENHKRHILHCGTHVLQVRGAKELKATVIKTGYDTEKGEMVRSILFPKPMDFHIYSDFLRLIFIFIILGLAAMTWSLVNWGMKKEVSVQTMIFNSIDLLTFVVPPIIPATITAINLWAQKRLQKQRIFCLSSNYISLAGPVNIICFDKTGTLTEDDLSLESVVPAIKGEFLPNAKDTSEISKISKFTQALATCHSVVKDPDGSLIGNPLDIKIFTALGWNMRDAETKNSDSTSPLFVVEKTIGEITCEYEVFKAYPFESSEQRMTVVGKERSRESYEIFIKGAPEKIVRLCATESVPDTFFAVLEWYTKQGLRILASAYKQLPNSITLEMINDMEKEMLERDSIFLGLIILQNKLKPETTPALQIIHEALINTVMVTGDNLLTATSVARQCGLVKTNQQIIFVKATYIESSTLAAQHIMVRFTDSESSPPQFDKNFPEATEAEVNRNYVFGVDGETFQLLAQFDKETFVKIIQRGKIFARMKPDQKIEVIEQLQQLGHQVAMCGDGCNDCGALKAAHAGISLSTTEASVAAPFTSLQQDIGCIITLIREGRATLMSSYVSFKYNISYSFSSLIVVLFIFTIYTEPSDTQYLIMDLVMITVPSLVMGNTEAAPYLSIQKPSKRVVHPLHIASIISFLLFQTLLFHLSWKYLEMQSWFEPFDMVTDEVRPPPGYESTAIIIEALWAFVFASIIFSHDFPFRKPFYTNKILTGYIIFSSILCFIFMFCQVEWLYKLIDFKPFPYSGFTWTLFLFALFTGAFCFVWERWFLYGFIEQIVLPWIARLRGTSTPYERLEEKMREDTNWPKLHHEEIFQINERLNNNSGKEVEDMDASHKYRFFRKSTKHKFIADVKYVDELKPLPVNQNQDFVENDSHPPNHFIGMNEERRMQTFHPIIKKDDGRQDNTNTNGDSHSPSELETGPDQAASVLAETYENQEDKNTNLIRKMNSEWTKIRTSLHESMKEFEMQFIEESLDS